MANLRICQDMLGKHLCFATRDSRFREAFGISSKSILWALLNVPNEGPEGGKQEHLLWFLLFLKTYNTQHDLAGRCRVCKDKFKLWQILYIFLWVLLFLKTYNTQHDLAGRCGVCKDTFKLWRNLFLEQITSLAEEELVSDVVVPTFNFTLLYLTCLLLFPNLLAIRLTSKTDI